MEKEKKKSKKVLEILTNYLFSNLNKSDFNIYQSSRTINGNYYLLLEKINSCNNDNDENNNDNNKSNSNNKNNIIKIKINFSKIYFTSSYCNLKDYLFGLYLSNLKLENDVDFYSIVGYVSNDDIIKFNLNKKEINKYQNESILLFTRDEMKELIDNSKSNRSKIDKNDFHYYFEFDKNMNVYQTRGLKEDYKNKNDNLIRSNINRIKNYFI